MLTFRYSRSTATPQFLAERLESALTASMVRRGSKPGPANGPRSARSRSNRRNSASPRRATTSFAPVVPVNSWTFPSSSITTVPSVANPRCSGAIFPNLAVVLERLWSGRSISSRLAQKRDDFVFALPCLPGFGAKAWPAYSDRNRGVPGCGCLTLPDEARTAPA